MISPYLSQIDGEVDFVVFESSRQRGRLPPPFRSVDGEFGLVRDRVVFRVAFAAQLALEQHAGRILEHVGRFDVFIGADESAVSIRFRQRFPACCRGFDVTACMWDGGVNGVG